MDRRIDDRELFDTLRIRAKLLCNEVARSLKDAETEDGAMAPHVAKERVEKLHRLGEKLIAMANLAKVLP